MNNSSHRGTTTAATSGYRVVVTLGITLLAAVAAFFSLNMGQAHAATGWGCVGTLANPTPCTVTHAEFAAVHKTMTRHQVHETFGVTGHRLNVGTYNYPDGDYHLAISYPAPSGDATVIFEDKGDGTLTLTSKLWSAPR